MLLIIAAGSLKAQELFVFTEPASNMPSHSVSAKLTSRFPASKYNKVFKQRYTPEAMFGISKQLMVHVSSTFSNFYSPSLNWESAKLYGKWRFFSQDDIHEHFRLAAFAEGSYSKSRFIYGDINLDGDNSGLQAGLIATKLVDKFALSATSSVIRVFTPAVGHSDLSDHSLKALNYSLSAGYLLFPRNYTDYKQTNLNVYMEMIGMQALNQKHYMLDLAPSLQFIFNSNFKINAGYRFQVNGDMVRLGPRSWVLALERTFL
jgi:hypothetical protein